MHKQGFGIIGLVITLAVIVILASGGYYFYTTQNVSTRDSSPKSAEQIRVISPKSGDSWRQGKTYKVSWTGGEEKVGISLIDKSLEKDGASISKVWSVPSIKNEGYYYFSVPIEIPHQGYRGTYKLYISDGSGYAYSDYFTITAPPEIP